MMASEADLSFHEELSVTTQKLNILIKRLASGLHRAHTSATARIADCVDTESKIDDDKAENQQQQLKTVKDQVQTIQNDLKQAMTNSRPLFEMKAHLQSIMEDERNKDGSTKVETSINSTSDVYLTTQQRLEAISNNISHHRHKRQQHQQLFQLETGTREDFSPRPQSLNQYLSGDIVDYQNPTGSHCLYPQEALTDSSAAFHGNLDVRKQGHVFDQKNSSGKSTDMESNSASSWDQGTVLYQETPSSPVVLSTTQVMGSDPSFIPRKQGEECMDNADCLRGSQEDLQFPVANCNVLHPISISYVFSHNASAQTSPKGDNFDSRISAKHSTSPRTDEPHHLIMKSNAGQLDRLKGPLTQSSCEVPEIHTPLLRMDDNPQYSEELKLVTKSSGASVVPYCSALSSNKHGHCQAVNILPTFAADFELPDDLHAPEMEEMFFGLPSAPWRGSNT